MLQRKIDKAKEELTELRNKDEVFKPDQRN